MTHRNGNILVIKATPHKVCSICGRKAETRPYGKNGTEICFQCGMKNKAQTEAEFKKLLLF